MSLEERWVRVFVWLKGGLSLYQWRVMVMLVKKISLALFLLEFKKVIIVGFIWINAILGQLMVELSNFLTLYFKVCFHT